MPTTTTTTATTPESNNYNANGAVGESREWGGKGSSQHPFVCSWRQW